MKKIALLLLVFIGVYSYGQIDRDQLSLDISKAEAANYEQLKEFIWNRVGVATVDGVKKLTTTANVKFNEKGELDVNVTDADTDVKQKRGVRGRVQANKAEDNMDYVQDALNLAVDYTYMSKGQLIDFFGKAEITESNGVITATAKSVFMEGDVLTVMVDSKTKLFKHKNFSGFLGEKKDPISGEINYEKFSSGIVHPSGSTLNLPAKKAVIVATNQDYSKRVQ